MILARTNSTWVSLNRFLQRSEVAKLVADIPSFNAIAFWTNGHRVALVTESDGHA